jgi:hypothetical protein
MHATTYARQSLPTRPAQRIANLLVYADRCEYLATLPELADRRADYLADALTSRTEAATIFATL